MTPVRRSRSRLASIAVAVVTAAVITAAVSLPASALAAPPFTAKLFIGTHQPKVGKQPLTVTATRGRQRLSGTVRYQFLYNGLVVGRQPGGSFRNGVYHDTLAWPRKAVGHTIRLQVIVRTRYGTDYLYWWIKVRP